VSLVTRQYDAKMVATSTWSARCTPPSGSKELDVPLVQMNALMGFVATLDGDHSRPGLERDKRSRPCVPSRKLLWIQNDLITRHYQGVREEAAGRLRCDSDALGAPHFTWVVSISEGEAPAELVRGSAGASTFQISSGGG